MPNRFVVDMGDLKLDEAARRRIANAIQAAALGELARLDSATTEPFAVYDPVRIRDPRWYGIWIRPIENRELLPRFEEQMQELQRFSIGG
jgi:hypothetical protein